LDDDTKRALALVGRVETEVLVDTDESDPSASQELHMNKPKKKNLTTTEYDDTDDDDDNNNENDEDDEAKDSDEEAAETLPPNETIIDITHTTDSDTDEDDI
jgi:hypothetical protein